MFLQEKMLPLIEEMLEEKQTALIEPEYLKTLFFDHVHLMIDFDNLEAS